MFRDWKGGPIVDRELRNPDDSGELCELWRSPDGCTIEYGWDDNAEGSAYACIGGVNIEDVNDRAAIGIISDPKVAGGLPVPDIEVPEIEGESEYWRVSEMDGTLIGADMRWLDEDDEP
jgi:hypothetical protein